MNRYVRRYREIQKRSLRSRHRIIKMAAISFLLLVIFTFYGVWARSFTRRQSGEMDRLRTCTLELSADIDRLQKQLDSLTSRASIVKRSTTELDMIFPDQEDLVFVVMDSISVQTEESR